MKIEGIIWLRDVVDKLATKHHVEPDQAGRYLAVLFIYKETKEALVLSARDMARREREQYGKK